MATNFPTSLDTFPSAATLATQTLATSPHSTLHGDLGDALAAVEAKVGVTGSAVTTSLDYLASLFQGLTCGRLTLTSGTPVTTSDVTGAGTVYYTPYQGDAISLYDTGLSRWVRHTFSEVSLSLSGITLNLPSDIFGYWTGSALALEKLNWTNGTTRATALVLQNGVRVKSGDATRLYLGTVCGSGSGTCEDSVLKRFVYNAYNKADRNLLVLEATGNWAYTTGTYRSMNGSDTNRVQLVSGTGEDTADLIPMAAVTSTTTANPAVAVGIDSTSTATFDLIALGGYPNVFGSLYTFLKTYPAPGYHYYQALEKGAGSGTTTWYGNSSLAGITGRWRG
jgi:hypothetical protein